MLHFPDWFGAGYPMQRRQCKQALPAIRCLHPNREVATVRCQTNMMGTSLSQPTTPPDPASNILLELPVRVTWFGDRPLVEWRRVSLAAIRGPLFEVAVAGAPLAKLAPLDELDASVGPGPIKGAIHHTWRCGSTLICAQFNAAARTLALSEPYLFSNLLVGHAQPPELAQRRIRQLAGALGTALRPVADHVVIKWPGLLAQHRAELEAALPEVQGIFLHRDPLAVVASLIRRPLGSAFDLPRSYFGALPSGVEPDSLLGAVHLIAATCRAVAASSVLRRCDYAALPAATATQIAPWFGIALDERDRAALAEAAQWHSKHPPGTSRFTADPVLPDGPEVTAQAEQAAAIIAPALDLVRTRLDPL
jgi:hypothetical protein